MDRSGSGRVPPDPQAGRVPQEQISQEGDDPFLHRQKERIFFWTYDEFTRWEPGPRRPTAYYHDAWHVRQFLTLGDPPNDTEVLIDREQDAMVQQLAVAAKLACDATMIAFLQKYASDREAIRARLSQGVGFAARVRPHLMIVD